MRSRSGEHARPALGTLLDWGKALLGGMLDLALPPACLLCRSPLPPGAFLCDPCRAEVPFQDGSLCPGCGGGPAAGPFDFCRSCREKSYFRDGLVTLASFRGAARELIHSFKYRGDLGAGRFLADRLGRKVLQDVEGKWDAVVPVPLHRSRLRARGFNQAVLLGRGIGRINGVPLRPAVLARRGCTSPLAGMSRRQRAREVRGSISVRPGESVEGCRFILVDDVITSGATAEECSRCLKEAGAAAVVVAAAGRTPSDPSH